MNNLFPKYYEYAFFSGFTTVNEFRRPLTFFEDEIRSVFYDHKSALKVVHNCMPGAIEKEYKDDAIYEPIPYCLMGDFDLAIFSLIDDFSFATKKFKPSSRTKNFKYQVNTGIIPLIEAYSSTPHLQSFYRERIPKFFSGKERYPFVGLASIKLNNEMLVGLGQEFLEIVNFFLISFIDCEILKLKKYGVKMFYIINENLGWNESTVYFFGNSIDEIQRLIFRMRAFSLAEIEKFLVNLRGDFNQDKVKSILKSIEKISKDSLLSEIINKGDQSFLSSQPIIATSLTYGYHAFLADLIGNKEKIMAFFQFSEKEYCRFNKESKLKIISVGWKIKPGHEVQANKILKNIFPSFWQTAYQNVMSGKFPFRYPQKKISLRKFLNLDMKLQDIQVRQELKKHIIKCRSRVRWLSDIQYKKKEKDKSSCLDLERYQFSEEDIRTIKNQLRIYPIPYTFKSQIENIIINFNDAITDPLMYNYFIGLKGSLSNFFWQHFKVKLNRQTYQKELASQRLQSIVATGLGEQNIAQKGIEENRPLTPETVDINSISWFIQTWNKAYWNRYFHSYYFTEINDFNIEHHGGIQQIVLTYDVIYKLISKRIYGNKCKRPFINVQVSPTISSSQYYNTVNFVHLFLPAIYACECVHEVSNYIIPFLIEQGYDDFDLLMNPKSDTIEPKRLLKLEKLEAAIYNKVDPRDEFEVKYIKERFGLNTTRHIVADYITFKLGYQNDTTGTLPPDKKLVLQFYQTHWFQLLLRADLYARETNGEGAWFFLEEEFKALFIRFNLMFYLCLDYDKDDLIALNKTCPSVELKPFWESEKSNLITFVTRLGKAIVSELSEQLGEDKIASISGFRFFIETIQKRVIVEGWKELNPEEQDSYNAIFEMNKNIIDSFFAHFAQEEGTNFNIIKRLGRNEDLSKDSNLLTNVKFYAQAANREIFLDPKGNIFTASPFVRQEIHKSNVAYLKGMWDLALKIMKKEYS